MRRLLALAAAACVVALAGPASAIDPIADDETKADVAASLAEATAAQGVCYGWTLTVDDFAEGTWNGVYLLSNLGVERTVDATTCPKSVTLVANITYTSELNDAPDSASWVIQGVGTAAPDVSALERLGLRAGDLLDDGKSEQTFINAVLALPVLTAELGGAAPVVLPSTTASAPPEAQATGRPGSDALRERRGTVILLILLIAGCLWYAWAAYTGRVGRPEPPPYRRPPTPTEF